MKQVLLKEALPTKVLIKHLTIKLHYPTESNVFRPTSAPISRNNSYYLCLTDCKARRYFFLPP